MWKEENDRLVREFSFDNFSEAFGFMSRVALLAEQHQHHPTIWNEYNKLKLELSSHDAGNKVTDKDHKLAQAISDLL